MEDLRLDTLAPFVVAWHNRHPLAHRIAAQQIQSVGYVLLPFEQPGVPPDPPLLTLTDEVHLDESGLEAGNGGARNTEPSAAAASLRSLAAARAAAENPADRLADTGSGRAVPTAPPPKGLTPAFSEAFFEHTSARRVARWAQHHGAMWAGPGLGSSGSVDGADLDLTAAFPGALVRQVAHDPAVGAGNGRQRGRRVHLVLRTACIEVGGDRLRLLLGSGVSPQVLGPRCLSRQRVFSVLALGLGASAAAAGLWLGPGSGEVPVLAAAPARVSASAPAPGPLAPFTAPPAFLPAAAAASVPASVSASASASPSAAAAAQASAPASAVAPVQIAAPAPTLANEEQPARAALAGVPPDAQPQLGKVFLPPLSPFFDEPRVAAARAKKQAERAEQAEQAASQAQGGDTVRSTAAAPPPAGVAMAGAPVARPVPLPPPPPAAATGPVFALSTRLLRTAAESEQLSSAMRTVLASQGGRDVRVEVLPAGDDWRVVGWPFASRDQANKSRALLMARGLKVEVVDF